MNRYVTIVFAAIVKSPDGLSTPKGKDEEAQCRHCGTALSHWPRGSIDRFSPPLQLTLRLESTILRSLSGQAPDPFWVGNVDAETFANLVSDLFLLLAEPDRQGLLALADHLGVFSFLFAMQLTV
jgi:hypothetical protein